MEAMTEVLQRSEFVGVRERMRDFVDDEFGGARRLAADLPSRRADDGG
jgi:hypothetical protein